MLKVKLKSRKRYNTVPGNGLGLSLANDIVKVHGGELKVETKEDEGSVFTIEISV
jgi:two-component system, NtrC family, sensor kinase